MNRRYEQFQLSLEKKVVTLYAQFAVGGTGAPTLSAANSKGVTSVTRNGDGLYTIVLQDRYVRLMGLNPTVTFASGSPLSNLGFVLRASTVSASTKSFQFEFLNGSFAGTDLASGSTVNLEIVLKASSV